MIVRRAVPLTAAVAALTVMTAPPAPAEPAENRPYSQLVPFADLDPAKPARTDLMVPLAVDVTPAGTVYVADSVAGTLHTVDADATVAAVPGSWIDPGQGPDHHSIPERPIAVTVAGDGTVYVLTPGSVRRVTPDGTGSVIAGLGEKSFFDHGDGGDGGPAAEAMLWGVKDIAVDAAGNLYVADMENDRVRRIDPSGVITTFAGGGDFQTDQTDGIPATAAHLDAPSGVDVDADGNVYVLASASIRKISTAGTISTVIGQQPPGFAGDGGPATKGQMGNLPADYNGTFSTGGLDVDAEGTIYFADGENGFVRRIDTKGVLTTLGPLVGYDIGVGPNGDIYQGVNDEVTVLRKKTALEPRTVAAGPEPRWAANHEPGTVLDSDKLARGASMTGIEDIHVQPSGALVLEQARRYLRVDANGTAAPFKEFSGENGSLLAFGQDGSVYADPAYTGIAGIERQFPDGVRQPLVGDDGDIEVRDGVPGVIANAAATDVAVTTRGDLYFTADMVLYRADEDGAIRKAATFHDDEPTTSVHDLTAGPDGSLYVINDDLVQRVDEHHQVTTVAGGGPRDEPAEHGDGGPADEAVLDSPRMLAVSPAGYVYIGTYEGVRRVDLDGYIATLPTVPDPLTGYDDPTALATDQHGNLYFAAHRAQQLMVVVHADDVVLPRSFPWTALGLGILVLAAFGAGGWGILRYRKNNAGVFKSAS